MTVATKHRADRLVSWRGKPIEQLTREELVDALNFVSKQLRETLECKQRCK